MRNQDFTPGRKKLHRRLMLVSARLRAAAAAAASAGAAATFAFVFAVIPPIDGASVQAALLGLNGASAWA